MRIEENIGLEVYAKGSDMDKKLKKLAKFLSALSPNDYDYYVDDTYFDYGQGWIYTTVLCRGDGEWGGYQALNPKEQEAVFFADTTDDLYKIAKEVLADKFCPDKIKR